MNPIYIEWQEQIWVTILLKGRIHNLRQLSGYAQRVPSDHDAKHEWNPPMKQSPGRSLAAAAIVAAGFLFLAGVLTLGFAKTNPGGKDFIEYWAVEQGLVHFAHPYDAMTILGIERAAGFRLQRPEFWYSPPPALVLALPLGYLGAKSG